MGKLAPDDVMLDAHWYKLFVNIWRLADLMVTADIPTSALAKPSKQKTVHHHTILDTYTA